ncbi:MAG: cytochrome c [Thalassobaculum sp.]|uniref:c-type cytochrome n=1 Tax=Thalassobaculum sp. TaxID=2022740 RepID=UPI0032ED7E89
MSRPRMCTRLASLLALAMLTATAAAAAETTLTVVDADGASHRFPVESLLGRPDVETVTVAGDPAYGDASPAYRAIPLTGLLAGLPVRGADILEATALDGFVAQLPAGKALSADPAGARAWLAIEDPAKPWPNLPGKKVSAGPYYLVWSNPKRSGIGPEAWPYQAVTLKLTASVASRFPAIVVAETLAADDPARRGQAVFVDNCFACHRMNGAGEASIGPDLNLPMNPTEYFQPEVLPLFIRDPKTVRDWGEQKMPGFGPDVLGDRDLDAVIAYLAHMAGRR